MTRSSMAGKSHSALFASSGVLLVAASLSMLVGLAWFFGHDKDDSRTTAAEIEQFKVAAEPAVLWLQQHKAQQGQYPSEIPLPLRRQLDECGVVWWYKISDKGQACYLGYGDYAEQGFSIFWTGESGCWVHDE